MAARLSLLPMVLLLASCGEQAAADESREVTEQPAIAASIVDLTADEMAGMRGAIDPPQLIDVRTPEEYAERHIEGARLIPLATFDPAALDGEQVVIYCRSGRRSAEAAEMLARHRDETVAHLAGGINAWEEAGYEVVRP